MIFRGLSLLAFLSLVGCVDNTGGGSSLTVVESGSGLGTVTSASGELNCGNYKNAPSICSSAFSSGTSVTLKAEAYANSKFLGWSGGGCSGMSQTCVLTVKDAQTVTAQFNVVNDSIDVVMNGSGFGTVTSTPSGITCGNYSGALGSCSEIANPGDVITLTAVPLPNSKFIGWTGDCSGTSTVCTVTMANAQISVTAQFKLDQNCSGQICVHYKDTNSYKCGCENDTQNCLCGNETQSCACGNDTQNCQCGNATYDCECGNGTYNCGCGDDSNNCYCGDQSYDCSCGNGTYNCSCGDDSGNCSCGDDTYDCSCGDGSNYNCACGNDSNNCSCGNDSGNCYCGDDSGNCGCGNESYSCACGDQSYNCSCGNDSGNCFCNNDTGNCACGNDTGNCGCGNDTKNCNCENNTKTCSCHDGAVTCDQLVPCGSEQP